VGSVRVVDEVTLSFTARYGRESESS
jgi:hypothetical protein